MTSGIFGNLVLHSHPFGGERQQGRRPPPQPTSMIWSFSSLYSRAKVSTTGRILSVALVRMARAASSTGHAQHRSQRLHGLAAGVVIAVAHAIPAWLDAERWRRRC